VRFAITPFVLLTASLAAGQPLPLTDANCDGRSSVADVTAALIVSFDSQQFPNCADADQFRDHLFSALDEALLLDDLYGRREPEWTPTPTSTTTNTPTPTLTRTATPSPSRTRTPTLTRSATITATPTETPTPTPSSTHTPLPSVTPTNTGTPTNTSTPTPTVTRTPTGLAQRLAGSWAADWQNQTISCCFPPPPSPPLCVADTVYRVTAAPNGQVTIGYQGSGQTLGTATVGAGGTVTPPTVLVDTGTTCFGKPVLISYDYTFTFNTNGTGSAQVVWTYGAGTNCQQCDVSKQDSATLQRVAGP